ncbi:MAG: hypothetical protein HJJLKODD_00586 [Phycisphaerae bacterium]|nr:hypothetical protein [Phycisphaerae bacterium]
MSWKAYDRNQPVMDPQAPPVLTEAVREKIRSFFPRYETKRAVLLPALHIVQELLGYVSYQAMKEIADLLEIHASDVLDVVSFYTHFANHPKGRKTVMVCRSLSCELMGGKAVLEAVKNTLQIQEHGTSTDGQYFLVTEECLAECDHAPCLKINERTYHQVKATDVSRILADEKNAELSIARSSLFDPPGH